VWSAYRGQWWNLSGRCLFPVRFCRFSKFRCRRDIFTSSHPSLCIVIARTSVHLRLDPLRSCVSPDRATELQRACQSRDLNIDSSENASAHVDGWNYKWNNWTGMSILPQNNWVSRYKLCVLLQWGGEEEKGKKRSSNDTGLFVLLNFREYCLYFRNTLGEINYF